jgi:uroporphyrinogen decarboxylase
MENLQNRRHFLRTLGLVASTTLLNSSNLFSKPKINKREAVFNLIKGEINKNYTPVGFFVHFGDGYKVGDAAVNRHLEYFRAIDMDFVKIQYESEFPKLTSIKKPEDWAKMPLYGKDFYEKQLYIVKQLVKKGKKLAPVIATLYSPFMCAGHTVGSDLLTEHMKHDPESVKKGMEIIAESNMIYAKECIKLGVDGFLASTQGGEAFRFQDPTIFKNYVKPYDLRLMNEINEACSCNILHICDYVGDYNDLSPFYDYPGHIVNCDFLVGDKVMAPKEIAHLFNRPVFGGMEKRGPISKENPEDLKMAVKSVLENAPDRFILGAECALLGKIDWKQVRLAVDIAHEKKV